MRREHVIPMLACEYRDARRRWCGCVGVVTPRRDEALTPRPTRLRCQLTSVQLRAAAAAVLPVAVASQSVECEHVILMLASQYREARWIGGVVVGAS